MATPRKSSGFTLVEMLVVITIIGILVGLLVPAISMAREAARRAQCINNQKNIAAALIAYQGAKGHLPGVFNRVDPQLGLNSPMTTWVMAIFGDIDRNDLLEAWRDGTLPNAPIQKPTVELLLCPSNKEKDPAGGLSYVVNMGIYKPISASNLQADYSTRLFRDRSTVASNGPNPEPDFSFTALKNSAQTIMLSESLTAGSWTAVPTTAQCGPPGGSITKPWPYDEPALGTLINDSVLGSLAFAWPMDNNPTSTLPSDMVLGGMPMPGLSSYHRGSIVVSYCDGHVGTLLQGTPLYRDPESTIYGNP